MALTSLDGPVPSDACPGDAPVVLLAGPDGLTTRLSRGLRACSDWPQGVALVVLCDQGSTPAGGEAQHLAAWRIGLRPGDAHLCTLLLGGAQMSTEDVARTQAWRLALSEASWPHAVLHGDESAQQEAALAVVLHAWARWQRGPASAPSRKWRWICEDCDDGDCEQHWLPGAGKPAL